MNRREPERKEETVEENNTCNISNDKKEVKHIQNQNDAKQIEK